jgi:hypothetical protein
MSIRVFFVMILFLLPLTAEAQRGGGSSRGGSSAGSSVRSSGNTAAPRGNSQARGQTTYRARPTTLNGTRNATATVPRGAGGSQNHSSLRGSGVAAGSFHHGTWWGGGIYLGFYYGPGWYYFPGYWYANSWWAYQYAYEPYITASGVKFDLSQIPKADRKAVDDGGVYLPDGEGGEGCLGSVKEFSGKWHKALPLRPGTHNFVIALADGRTMEMSVTVQPQRTTTVALRSEKPDTEESQR